MLIKHTRASDPKPSEITSKSLYLNRRKFIKTGFAGAMGAAILPFGLSSKAQAVGLPKLEGVVPSSFSTDEPINSYEQVTSYNNFYEFGTGKTDPLEKSGNFKPRPWTITVDGLCHKPGQLDFEDMLSKFQLEERIYRLRCVEAWSMVVPWVGIEMASVLKSFEPKNEAKYVHFRTLVDVEQFPGQRFPVIAWPYTEGLRMDEAMNPLSIFSVGIFGEEMPAQNGAPVRTVIPWKYGFKSIKSIVSITFSDKPIETTWMRQAPSEYGFYANVNPNVDHPRWTQAKERRIGEFFRQPTVMFNGYQEEVAHLYKDMDLKRFF